MSEIDKLIARMEQSIEMMQDGYQENLSKVWHDQAMKQAAEDLIDAMQIILSKPQPTNLTGNEE